jgi:hypothetical protein
MALEQFFLPPREWCESKLNENRRYFHLFSQKTVESIYKIVFGSCYHGHSPGGRSCERTLWNIDSAGNVSPAGYMCFRCSGFLKHDKEYGVLLLGNQRLEAERTSGNIVHIKLNDQKIGCFEWTFWSRFFYKGSGRFYNNDHSVSGKIHLPAFFVASNFHALGGMSDNTLWGNVTINKSRYQFQIHQADSNYYHKETPFEQDTLFSFVPKKTVEPIDDKITRLNLTEKDRLLLLYLFCRSIAFYQYSINKA